MILCICCQEGGQGRCITNAIYGWIAEIKNMRIDSIFWYSLIFCNSNIVTFSTMNVETNGSGNAVHTHDVLIFDSDNITPAGIEHGCAIEICKYANAWFPPWWEQTNEGVVVSLGLWGDQLTVMRCVWLMLMLGIRCTENVQTWIESHFTPTLQIQWHSNTTLCATALWKLVLEEHLVHHLYFEVGWIAQVKIGVVWECLMLV